MSVNVQRIRTLLGQVPPARWHVLYTVLLLPVIAAFYSGYAPVPELESKLKALVSAAFLTASFVALGRLLLRRAGIVDPSTPMQFGVGLGTTSLVILLLGWDVIPGSLTLKFTIWTLFLGTTLVLAVVRGLRLRWPPGGVTSTTEIICLGIAGVGLLFSLSSCFSPITYYDSLVYHLALPALYNAQGHISTVPFNLYSLFPANLEMIFLYVINQFPEPDYTINLICWMMALLAAVEIFHLCRSIAGRREAAVAFALWWTMPAVIFLSVGAYVDVALALFTLLAVTSFLRAMKSKGQINWFILSGVFSGLAMGIKYTGVICPVILCAFMATSLARGKGNAQGSGAFALATLLTMSPWLIKNIFSVGNPFFPFFYSWFGGNAGWTTASAEGYFKLLTQYGSKSHILGDLFLTPWRIGTSGVQFGGGFDVLGDFGWQPFIYGAPVVLFFARKNKAVMFLLAYSCLHFLLWWFTKPVLRFLISLLPVLTVLASLTVGYFLSKGRSGKLAAAVLVGPWVIFNAFTIATVSAITEPLTVALGRQTRAEFLNRKLSYFPAYQAAEAALSSTDKILLIGEQRTYHLDLPFIGTNFFAPSPAADYCNAAKSASEAYLTMKKQGITHVLINEPELERLGGLKSLGFSDEGIRIFKEILTNHSTPIWRERGVVLAVLLSGPKK